MKRLISDEKKKSDTYIYRERETGGEEGGSEKRSDNEVAMKVISDMCEAHRRVHLLSLHGYMHSGIHDARAIREPNLNDSLVILYEANKQ